MIIKAERLIKALKQIPARNTFIEELVDSSQDDKKRRYKLILAFWLGSNITFESLRADYLLPRRYIYIGYYCFLILDKQISAVEKTDPLLFEALSQCFQELMVCFNEHFELLYEDPRLLFSMFKSIIEALDGESGMQPRQHSVLNKTKQACLNELARVLGSKYDLTDKPLKETISLSDADYPFFNSKIKEFRSKTYLPFYRSLPWGLGDYKCYKMIMSTKDGNLIDGLFLGKRGSRSKSVVLALIGHFPSEHDYIASQILNFQNLFETDIVFINHRNYAKRSNTFLINADELKHDVIVFADYFKQKERNIVLYGMCGGAAQMILAANALTEKQVPYKLIVDRFAGKYEQFADIKTLQRGRAFYNPPPPLFKTHLFILYFFGYLLLMMMVKLMLYFAGEDISFARLIRLIPENDLLILQAKSKKLSQGTEPLSTDMIVHPKNDIRTAIKDRRHQHKIILKHLFEDCRMISISYSSTNPSRGIFEVLAHCFQQCLQLIDDEKLKLDNTSVQDLHSNRLFELTTRHNLPIGKFLQGFYTNPSRSCKKTLGLLPSYAEDLLLASLNEFHTKDDKPANAHIVAHLLSHFLSEIKDNEPFICHMGNRLYTTGLGNLDEALHDLLNSSLFQSIKATSEESISLAK